jgi:osmoprotectant transport system ATP-binding protein
VEEGSAHSAAQPLEFRKVTKRYPGAIAAAVDGLSLEIPAGEICVLVGPSGCGKTTAMRMVNRMIDMTSGDILLGGRSVRDSKPSDLRREIGYVIQQIGLFPHRTIGDNIATVPSLLGWDRKRTAARVDELLELVGLDPGEMRGRYPAQLSGGQRQRIGVARALAADPAAMLMDEPFGAIDPINRERLQDEFLRLQATVRKTIVFVTHDIDEAIKMGNRIAILREGGHLAQYGTPQEILARPADDFVARFVGTDRGLKRLSLTTLGQLDLAQLDGDRPDLCLPATMSARDALSVLLTAGGGDALVVGEGDRPLGIVSVAALGGLLADARIVAADVQGPPLATEANAASGADAAAGAASGDGPAPPTADAAAARDAPGSAA